MTTHTSSGSKPNSQIVYTSVDDDMTVTEIICEYDYEETVPEAVCELEASDSGPAPVIEQKKDHVYVDNLNIKQESEITEKNLYIDDSAVDEEMEDLFGEDKKFKCGVCSEQFDDLPTVSRHMEEHSGEKKYECAECGKQFKNINNVMRHMVIHSGDRKHPCPVCEKSFTQVGNLKRHLIIHSGEKKFPCSLCGKSFTQMNNLIRHQLIHTGQKNFECNICHRMFNQASNLHRHTLIHKGLKLFKCDICDKSFSQLINLQKHKERHMRGHKYTCEVCHEGFNHKNQFTKHLHQHYGKPQYQCNICGKIVTQQSTLNQHMLLHTEPKQHICTICNKSYAQKGSLTKHLESHSQVKHICDLCCRFFYTKEGLDKHMASHTGRQGTSDSSDQAVKPDYDLQFCDLCGKTFILKRSLRKHMEKIHNVPMDVKKRSDYCPEQPCEFCGKVFIQRRSLKKHMLKKHNMEIQFATADPSTEVENVKVEPDVDTVQNSSDVEMEDDDYLDEFEDAQEKELDIQIIQGPTEEEALIIEGLKQLCEETTLAGKPSEFLSGKSSPEGPEPVVHLCEMCDRGFYLLSNLHRHMENFHKSSPSKEKTINKSPCRSPSKSPSKCVIQPAKENLQANKLGALTKGETEDTNNSVSITKDMKVRSKKQDTPKKIEKVYNKLESPCKPFNNEAEQKSPCNSIEPDVQNSPRKSLRSKVEQKSPSKIIESEVKQESLDKPIEIEFDKTSDSTPDKTKTLETKVRKKRKGGKRGPYLRKGVGVTTGDDICDLCGRGYLTPADLLLHMLQHSKTKKDFLLGVVNEATLKLQRRWEADAELGVTAKTKDLVSHIRKCSRNQSNEISSVFSINDTLENFASKLGASEAASAGEESVDEVESIVSECVDFHNIKQEIIEINEFDDFSDH